MQPACRADDDFMSAALSRAPVGTALVVLVGVLAGLLINGGRASGDPGALIAGPIPLLILLVPAAIVLTSLHETAHALVGRLLGWDVFGVTIGHGRRHATLHLGSVRLELCGLLVGGVTIARPTGRRWRDVAMLVAGITVETIVIAATLPWTPVSIWSHSAKWAIVLVACTDIAVNLWPRRLDLGPVSGVSTDGAQLLSVLTTPDQWRHDLQQQPITRERARLVQALYGGDIDEAVELARTVAAADPADRGAVVLAGTVILIAGNWREAFEHLAPQVGLPDADPMLANNAAWAAVMTFDPSLLPDADRFSEHAFAGRPTEPACANTRGSTLVLLGRAEDGLPLLRLAAAGRLSQQQRAFVLVFTALAEHRLGDLRSASRHLALSQALDVDCPALPEVQRLMSEPPNAPNAAPPWPPPDPPAVGSCV